MYVPRAAVKIAGMRGSAKQRFYNRVNGKSLFSRKWRLSQKTQTMLT